MFQLSQFILISVLGLLFYYARTQKACEINHFGPNCTFTCHCRTGSCPTDTGICFIQGCKPGWLNDTCSEPCTKNKFGEECKTTCNCKMGGCDNVDGHCLIPGCRSEWTGTSCSTSFSGDYTPRTAGISVGVSILVLSAVLITIYMCRRRRNAQSNNEIKSDGVVGNVYDEIEFTEDKESSQDTEIQVSSTQDTRAFKNFAFDTTEINIENVEDEFAEKIQNSKIQKQHQTILSPTLYPQTAGNLMRNRKKNRDKKVVPYDHSRVVLETTGPDHHTDYINASYINGLRQDVRYIATQGPMTNTVNDFWSMVWQTNCSVIVMLVNISEKKQAICCQYWPVSSRKLAFHDYEIVLLEEMIYPEFVTRIMKLRNMKIGEERKIWHLQFTSWPNESVPNPYQLLLLHRKYVEISTLNSGIPIIHCSDGTDKTGVFIAFDAMYEYCSRNEKVNVCKFITEMRKNRMGLVNTKESYVLLHDMFEEQVRFQSTSFTKEFLKVMSKTDRDKEYKMLLETRPEYDNSMYKKAMLKKNQGRNRNSILSVEFYRVILYTKGPTSYINAVAIPSCKMPNQFFVTHLPLKNTVCDLWQMVKEYNCYTVVNLEDTQTFEKDLEWYPTDESKLKLTNLTLTKTLETIPVPGARESILNLSNKDKSNQRRVKVFQYLNWKQGTSTPEPQSSFLEFIDLVQTWNKSINNGPIIVVCADGAKYCGLFCLVYSVIENLCHSEEIDIYQMARLQQIRRPEFFNKEQYHFCYNIVQEYLEKSSLCMDFE